MQALVTEIYALQKSFQRMYDAHDQIPSSYDAEDPDAIEHFYAKVEFYEFCRDTTIAKHRALLQQYPDYKLYLKLADQEALKLFESLNQHLRFYGKTSR